MLKGSKKDRPKRPYVKPICVSEGIFETTALACGKLFAQGASCTAHPRAS